MRNLILATFILIATACGDVESPETSRPTLVDLSDVLRSSVGGLPDESRVEYARAIVGGDSATIKILGEHISEGPLELRMPLDEGSYVVGIRLLNEDKHVLYQNECVYEIGRGAHKVEKCPLIIHGPEVSAHFTKTDLGNGRVSVDARTTRSSHFFNSGLWFEWHWDEESVTFDTETTSHTYGPGTHRIVLKVFDPHGYWDDYDEYFTPGNASPVCNAGGPYEGSINIEVQFDGSGSSDPDGTIESYDWNFGDGSFGTGASPTHTYSSADDFTVTLTATDDEDNSSNCTTIAEIGTNEAPLCHAGGPYDGTVGLPGFQFDGRGSSDPDGTIVSYNWNFGDGTLGTGATPTHVYTATDTFTVSLSITDDDGNSSSCTTSANALCPEGAQRGQGIAGVDNAGDSYPDGRPGWMAPCADDFYCSQYSLTTGFIADGEWNPDSHQVAFVTTLNTVLFLSSFCEVAYELCLTGQHFPGPVTRSFAWGIAQGDFWVGAWEVTNSPPAALYHFDANGNEIASFELTDPQTQMRYQFSGLAIDSERGHLWGILRNYPKGTSSRLVEMDINGSTPIIIQGPIEVPWPGSQAAVGSAGLEYNQTDNTLIALRQDANHTGQTPLVVFRDVNPSGAGGVELVGECAIVNTPCSGAGPIPNRPWGIAVVETSSTYVIYSDLNEGGPNCMSIEQPNDFHIVSMP